MFRHRSFDYQLTQFCCQLIAGIALNVLFQTEIHRRKVRCDTIQLLISIRYLFRPQVFAKCTADLGH